MVKCNAQPIERRLVIGKTPGRDRINAVVIPDRAVTVKATIPPADNVTLEVSEHPGEEGRRYERSPQEPHHFLP